MGCSSPCFKGTERLTNVENARLNNTSLFKGVRRSRPGLRGTCRRAAALGLIRNTFRCCTSLQDKHRRKKITTN